MITVSMFRSLLLLTVMMIPMAGCSNGGSSPSPGDESTEEVTIFAAASLSDVFEEIRDVFEDEHPDLSLTLSFAGSSTLRTQLEEGAAADLFASANVEQMDLARDAGRIVGEPEIFARNRLALIVPAGNPAGIQTPGDLDEPGILLVLAQEQVPAGDYARASLELMSQDPEFDDEFAERVLKNLVSEEANVRSVATKVRLGEADAGIVYASDVTDDLRDEVQVIEIPEPFNVTAEYPAAIVDSAENEAGARVFLAFLLGPEAQDVLERHGFIPLDE
jgi:molybdate transport system substrate-binding protein